MRHVENAISSMTSLKNAEIQRLRAELRASGANMEAVQRVVEACLSSLPLPPRPLSPDDERMHALAVAAGVLNDALAGTVGGLLRLLAEAVVFEIAAPRISIPWWVEACFC